MQNKFKVGDIVRCVAGLSFGRAKVGRIVDIDYSKSPTLINIYQIVGGDFAEDALYRDEELELEKNYVVTQILNDL